MKQLSSTIKILLFISLSQLVFAQEKIQFEQKKTIICSDCIPMNAKAISLPIPEYPKVARAVNATGAVQVQIVIDENGNVIEAKAVSGHLLLWKASVDSALQAKFKPILLGGKPIRTTGVIVYNYVLSFPSIIEKTQIESPSFETKKNNFQSDALMIGKPISLVKPPFPNCNCKLKRKNIVLVKAEINEQGNITGAIALSGHSALKQVSVQAVLKSKFSPTFVGVRVKAQAIIKYEFNMNDEIKIRVIVKSVKPKME